MGNKKETKPTVIASRIEYIGQEVEQIIDKLQNSEDDEFALGTLKDKLEHIRNQFVTAQELHGELTCIVPDNARSNYEYFSKKKWPKFREKFEILLTMLESKIDHGYKSMEERSMMSSTPHLSDASHFHSRENPVLRLPKIEITPFDGNYDHWQNFSDIFIATVGNNSTLSNALKMQHLKTLLTGEAADVISTMAITDANYQKAWDLLKDRYDNKRALITHHLNKLSSIPTITQDSVEKLRSMRSTLQVSLGSLDLLGCTTSAWSTYLVHQMVQKFSINLRKDWEKTLSKTTEYPTYDDLISFLNDQINILENLDWHKEVDRSEQATKKRPKNTLNTVVKSTKGKCPHCDQDHSIYKCAAFQKLTPFERGKVRKEKQLCVNCLSRAHMLRDCESKMKCRVCHKPHHTLLHIDFQPREKFKRNNQPKPVDKDEDKNQTEVNEDGENSSTSTHCASSKPTDVMIATALVKVHAPNGNFALARALIDSGSESSFISESLAQLLKLKRRKADITINGLQGIKSSSPKHAVSFEITGATSESPRYPVYAYVLQCITAYKPKSFQRHLYPELNNLDLADPAPGSARKVDLLLGSDIIGQFWQTGVIHLSDSGLTAQASTLGWILSGPIGTSHLSTTTNVLHATSELPDLLRRFWEIEENQTQAPASEEDEKCEKLFRETTTRDANGRYSVQLPLTSTESVQTLGESKSIAVAAWKRVSKQLDKNPEDRKNYDEFMIEYERLKHMSEIPEQDKDADNYVYIPHLGVFRKDKITTQLRVVFNASSKTKSGVSLNDILSTGPKLQNDVVDVITNWRKPRYVYKADVTKMYRQILVHEDFRWLQCIVWNPAGSDELKYFKLNTVTYGTRPAPYLANRIIRAVAEDYSAEYPLAVEPLNKCTYVDDTIFGADTKESAIEVRNQVQAALARGCLELRKWASNSSDLLPESPDSTIEFFIEPEGETDSKVLGIMWSSREDHFSFKIRDIDTTVITKRIILSNTAKLYDPLGWISPYVIRAKMLMQSLWLIKADWDDPDLPEDVQTEWKALCEDLINLKTLTIPRFIGPGNELATVSLVGFSDASKRAYAATVYLYVDYKSGERKSHLLRSKTRVAPIKTQSIPRLELCGAVELAKLMQKIRENWLGPIDEILCYTDSQIVLDWFAKHASTWHTFVANRVSLVQTILPDVKWNHVSTKQNPADLSSRGVNATDLINSELWWYGPDLAKLNKTSISLDEEEKIKLEVEKEACHDVSSHLEIIPQLPTYLTKISSWSTLIRVIGYVYKYLGILKQRISREKAPSKHHPLWAAYQFKVQLETVQKLPWHAQVLSRDDIIKAHTHIYKVLQDHNFPAEMKRLKEGLSVSKGSPLYQFSPFLDGKGVMRMQGRLEHSNLPYSQKHPVMLANNRVTNTLIRYYHLKAMHAGLQQTLSLLRERYWILHVRNRAKLLIRKCVTCTRYRAQLETQRMSALPSERCNPSRPFSHVGLDYIGPFKMRVTVVEKIVETNEKQKKKKAKHGKREKLGYTSQKIWIALFICFATRAIHLEIVNDYSTKGFLLAYKSFVARRGRPTEIWSDNQRAFTGADRELTREFKKVVEDPNFINYVVSDQTKWSFIPPESPHYGGLWEASVKSFKHHFNRVMGDFTPSWDELRTIVNQIEACLNSRPLTPSTDHSTDDPALTPGHFLIGTSLEAVPEPTVLDARESLLDRWQTLTLKVQSFWKRWRHEYLQTLQRRTKWEEERENLKVGDVVLLNDKERPPCNWGMAKVIEIRPGKDNLIREVVLRIRKTQLVRAVTELCKLPVDETCEHLTKSPWSDAN